MVQVGLIGRKIVFEYIDCLKIKISFENIIEFENFGYFRPRTMIGQYQKLFKEVQNTFYDCYDHLRLIPRKNYIFSCSRKKLEKISWDQKRKNRSFCIKIPHCLGSSRNYLK